MREKSLWTLHAFYWLLVNWFSNETCRGRTRDLWPARELESARPVYKRVTCHRSGLYKQIQMVLVHRLGSGMAASTWERIR